MDSATLLTSSPTSERRAIGGRPRSERVIPCWTAVLLSVLCGSCGTRAVVSLHDGSSVHGRTLPGTTEEAFFLTREGDEVRVPRENIEDVDHPGTAAAVVGTALATVATTFAVVSSATCEDRADMYTCADLAWVLMSPVIITGASLTVWGVSVGLQSKRRLESTDGRERR